MKVCAITMVHRDHWALAQWYRHYAKHLGGEHLYVVAHGADPMVQTLCPKASVITIPRETFKGFDRVRGRMLNSFQTALREVYDWVIRTDADELICLDPDHFDNFDHLFSTQDAPALFALGLNVAEADGDAELDATQQALQHRKTAVFSGHYSKAWAINEPVSLMRHGVQVKAKRTPRYAFCLPKGVYLVHLKFANVTALQDANRHRQEVAASKQKGVPGTAWEDPGKEAARFFQSIADMPEKPWQEARDEAYFELGHKPVRVAETGIIRCRNIRFGHRTQLPDWFADF